MPRHDTLLALLLLGASLTSAIGLPTSAMARTDLREAQAEEQAYWANISYDAYANYTGHYLPQPALMLAGTLYYDATTGYFLHTPDGAVYQQRFGGNWTLITSPNTPPCGYECGWHTPSGSTPIDPHNPPNGWSCVFNNGYDFAAWYNRCGTTVGW
jgi:hypothetical protein